MAQKQSFVALTKSINEKVTIDLCILFRQCATMYKRSIYLFNVCCRAKYRDLGDAAIVINVLAVTLLALMILMPVLLLFDKFRSRRVQVVAVHGL